MDEGFKEIGESHIADRLRRKEDIHQKASAVLSDEVSIIVMSGHWISLWLPSAIAILHHFIKLLVLRELIWDISNFISILLPP